VTSPAAPAAQNPWDEPQARVDDLLAQGRVDEAVVLARTLTGRHPDDAWAWHRLAAALLVADDPVALGEARAAAERAVTLDPTSAMGYRMLSEAALRAGDPEAALATMRAAVQAAPESWVTHLDLAAALADRPGGAREAYRIAYRATHLAPQRPEPHLMLGDLALRAGDPDAAAARYSNALAIAPDYEMAQVKMAELRARTAAAGDTDLRLVRSLGNGLAVLALLAVLGCAMLLALWPGSPTGWYRAVVAVAAGGLILVAAAFAGAGRGLAPGTGYRVGLTATAVGLLAAMLTMLIGGLAGGGGTPLRAALCVALAGYAGGHLVARWAERAVGPVADRTRAAAMINLALGNLLHGVVFVAVALLEMALPPGGGQTVAVVVVVVLVFAAGIRYSALWRTPAAPEPGGGHRQRPSRRAQAVLAGVTAAGVVDVVGCVGALVVLFTGPATAVLLVATIMALALAAACAVSGATNRETAP
jgi:Flp pilus assembly protein TadD